MRNCWNKIQLAKLCRIEVTWTSRLTVSIHCSDIVWCWPLSEFTHPGRVT